MFISRSALRAVATPLRAQRPVPALRYLRTTSGPTAPPSSTSQTTHPASPDPSQPAAEPPRETQTGATPSGESVPPLSADKPVETPSAPGGSSPDPTPSSSSAASPASQVPPVDALSTRQNSIAEAFLDLHPDVAPRSEEEMRGNQFPGEKTGAKARGAGKSSIEKKRANLARAAGVLTVAGLAWAVYDLGKDWADEEEQKKMFARSDDKQAIEEAHAGGWTGWWGRLKIRAADHLDYLNKPAWDPLLPPPLPEPHYRPYTLVIDLEDMLTHDNWDLDHGWRTAKRPGADYFLAYMSQFYEIVLFTTLPSYLALPVIEQLDPYGAYIPWKLFKEATRYKNGMNIKDLSYLNRPLERTIILDTDPARFQLQPTNGIPLKPWMGTKGDATANELVAMIPFLEAIAIKQVKDVRPIIKHYEGKHIPTAYMEAEAKTKKELLEKWEQQKKDTTVKGWISRLFGGLTATTMSDAPPETDIEKMRKTAQKLYLDEQKYWKDNAEIIQKQIEDDKQRQLKEMSTSLVGVMGFKPPSTAAPAQ
ncbi:mitochondrial translocase complex component TIM50 [Rhodotorula toruloides]|uniref:Mitochondrial import inner membrane translocase subunit TIM50 n=1 Tax=Rhodotorula toruloides TaxID=5286 RepID=A0A511KFT0_RHOTO|nr:mitochondrial translocase complex component TIM50 [Rhodotorula toruloides]